MIFISSNTYLPYFFSNKFNYNDTTYFKFYGNFFCIYFKGNAIISYRYTIISYRYISLRQNLDLKKL